MRIMRRSGAERAEQRDVLGSVAEVIFTPNDVGDPHFQIINHVDEVENRLPVRTHNDKIRVERFAVGQFARDAANHEVGNCNRARESSGI